uniref:Uncharacterized protein n=1 Tax=Chlamydomonas leiostraca TaxID=1034604 RepID=A0A7S0S2X6_9CHLO
MGTSPGFSGPPGAPAAAVIAMWRMSSCCMGAAWERSTGRRVAICTPPCSEAGLASPVQLLTSLAPSRLVSVGTEKNVGVLQLQLARFPDRTIPRSHAACM